MCNCNDWRPVMCENEKVGLLSLSLVLQGESNIGIAGITISITNFRVAGITISVTVL